MSMIKKCVAAATLPLLALGLVVLGGSPASAEWGNIGSGVEHCTACRVSTEYQAQQKATWSGPAATRIALTALGKRPTQTALAKELGTTASGTSSVSPVTRTLIAEGAGAYRAIHTTSALTATGQSLLWARIEDNVAHHRAVVAEIRIHKGSAATPPGYALTASYLDTFVTIVGYDEGADHSVDGHLVQGDHVKRVLVSDPASTSHTYLLTFADLVKLLPSGGYTYYQ